MTELFSDDLRQLSGAFQARKRPLSVQVEFAENDGSLQTREGPVTYRRGDAILTGVEGERWPVSRKRFEATYQPSETSGVYSKKPAIVWAYVAPSPLDVALPDDRGHLHAAPGDVIVQYAPGDQAVVGASIFAQTYERLPENTGATGEPPA
ncbi:hypothetical protein B1757_07345 [Acidithiobacillus marinus]|uniref:Uncharacterized protein n=2 Tax=Acidithiobacillus marinus TaxID=187490 RepID=A0A2I1DLM4_9PROT|nr:hypothetical protein B1757_07345 [Acidithiobacillus marinus]